MAYRNHCKLVIVSGFLMHWPLIPERGENGSSFSHCSAGSKIWWNNMSLLVSADNFYPFHELSNQSVEKCSSKGIREYCNQGKKYWKIFLDSSIQWEKKSQCTVEQKLKKMCAFPQGAWNI